MTRSLVIPWLVVAAMAQASAAETLKEDFVLYKNDARYSAFPSLTISARDELWVGFGWNTTRSHYGKAAGGQSGGIGLFSPDGGRKWYQAGKDDQYKGAPEKLSRFVLSDSTMIGVWPGMHEILPAEKKDELVKRGVAVKEWPEGHISASYRVLMRRKTPGSPSWKSKHLELPPFASMGGFGNGCVLGDDTVLKPAYGRFTVDEPADRSWVLRSADKGDTWELITIAYNGVQSLNEADLLVLPQGRVIAMIRSEPGSKKKVPFHEQGFLWQTHSDDGGKTWSEAKRTRIWGYPPYLLLLDGGDVLCTYGYRRWPYGIRACFSRDGGKTWDVEHEVILRSDALPEGPGPGKGYGGDLGYPRTVQLSDGSLLTVYYITLGDGVTHIAATRWSPDYLGPEDLPRGDAAIPKPNPALPPQCIIGETEPARVTSALMQSFIPTEPQIKMVAIRISAESGREDLTHTHGLSVVIRCPGETSWWTDWIAESRILKPEEVKIGAWNAFVFDKPVKVTPGKTYALTIYNKDFIGGSKLRLKEGLSGDHSWHVNSGRTIAGGYPNGSMDSLRETDLAFKVYGQIGPLPK